MMTALKHPQEFGETEQNPLTRHAVVDGLIEETREGCE